MNLKKNSTNVNMFKNTVKSQIDRTTTFNPISEHSISEYLKFRNRLTKMNIPYPRVISCPVGNEVFRVPQQLIKNKILEDFLVGLHGPSLYGTNFTHP